jgi:hypothetical protein
MTIKKWFERRLSWSNEDTIPAIAWRAWGKLRKFSDRIGDKVPEIRTSYHLNTRQNHYTELLFASSWNNVWQKWCLLQRLLCLTCVCMTRWKSFIVLQREGHWVTFQHSWPLPDVWVSLFFCLLFVRLSFSSFFAHKNFLDTSKQWDDTVISLQTEKK